MTWKKSLAKSFPLSIFLLTCGCARTEAEIPDVSWIMPSSSNFSQSSVDSSVFEEVPVLTVDKKSAGVNERVTIFEDGTPAVAWTFTKVSARIEDVVFDQTTNKTTEKDNEMIRVDLEYENLGFKDSYNASYGFRYSSTGYDDRNEGLILMSSRNDKEIPPGEKNTVQLNVKTSRLAKDVDFIKLKYYYYEDMVSFNNKNRSCIEFKLKVEH